MENKEIISKGMENLEASVGRIREIYLSNTKYSLKKNDKILIESSYFRGVADMLSVITGKEYQWSTPDSVKFSVVVLGKGEVEELRVIV